MSTLYKINESMLSILANIEENGGEITEEISKQLEITEGELLDKSESYLAVIKEKEAFETLIDEEIKRLQNLKKRNKNLISRLKQSLLAAVNIFGEFEVGVNKFGLRKTSSVHVEEVKSLPKEYKTVKISESADKKAIAKALKSGEEIEGCALITNYNLKIN